MDATQLATDIKKAVGHSSSKTSAENTGLAQAIVEELQKLSLVTFIPGGISGVAPSSGGKLKNGAGSGGKIVGPSPATIAARAAKKMGFGSVTPQLLAFVGGVVTHYLTGKVSFAVGKVTGKCTNSPSSPGALAGEASGGKIGGLSGSGMATACSPAFGGKKSSELNKTCTAIVNHIQTKAEVSFKTATIVGAISSGGGPVTAGAGTKGTVK